MRILDSTAGKRLMWLEKRYPDATFIDIRRVVEPTIVADSKALPLRESTFDLVLFDPPHEYIKETMDMSIRYGSFRKQEIASLIIEGAREFHRVLKDEGFLIAKWSSHWLNQHEFLSMLRRHFRPLFGHNTRMNRRGSTTYYVLLIKKEVVG